MKKIPNDLDNMSDDDFFALLDKRHKELSEKSKPLNAHQCRLYTTISEMVSGNDDVDDDKLSKATEIGVENSKEVADKIQKTMDDNGLKPANLNVKNIKTHRSQWFD
jgi:hypothetical protein